MRTLRSFGKLEEVEVCPRLFDLLMLDSATKLLDLRSPPGNKLHALMGDREGQHAIWINDKYRVCFKWFDGDAYDVEITDYHS